MAEAKGQILVLDTSVTEGNADFNKGLDSTYLEINDTKDKGTAGGDFTAGEFETRDLTTQVHDSLADSVTLGSNQFVIPAGTYRIEASVPAHKVDAHVARLADVTDAAGNAGATVVLGVIAQSGASDSVQTRSIIEGRFVVTRATTLEIQHRCETTRAADGFGLASNFYITDELYADVKMWQIIEDPPAPATPVAPITGGTQTESLLFDEIFQMVTPTANEDTVGISSTFSFSCWAKNEEDTPLGSDIILAVHGQSTANLVDLGMDHNTNTDIRLSIANNVGSSIQFRTWADVVTPNVWHHYVLTWGAATGTGVNGIHMYVDGVDLGVGTDSIDLSGAAMVDSARLIRVGGISAATRWTGPIYSAAIFNSVLTPSEVITLYNSGNARDFDVQVDSGNYESSANLIHYFRLGIGDTDVDFGTDRIGTIPDLSMEATPDPLDTTDLTTDLPDGT